jgi:hypothetical protein
MAEVQPTPKGSAGLYQTHLTTGNTQRNRAVTYFCTEANTNDHDNRCSNYFKRDIKRAKLMLMELRAQRLYFYMDWLTSPFRAQVESFIAVLKCCPTTRHAGAWKERSYSSYSFLTSALEEGERSASRPGHALAPGKGPLVPIGQEAGWTSELVWTQRLVERSFASSGDRSLVIRYYTV